MHEKMPFLLIDTLDLLLRESSRKIRILRVLKLSGISPKSQADEITNKMYFNSYFQYF